MMNFIIKNKLPSLNEVISVNRANRFYGAKFKAHIEDLISKDIQEAVVNGTLEKTEDEVILHFTWHEKTKRRDADNIASAKKFILDALVKNEILVNDNRKYVKGFTDTIVDDEMDYVEVAIERNKE